jgi:hypothetical protein
MRLEEGIGFPVHGPVGRTQCHRDVVATNHVKLRNSNTYTYKY